MKSQVYAINQSPLYAIRSKAKLAKVLLIEKSLLLDVSKNVGDGYKQWALKPRKRDVIVGLGNKKSRDISEPKGRLKDIHNRLSTLLSRIEKPDFVNSATKGRSYECNAIVHQKKFSEKSLKIDIKNFYPSVKKSLVENFFAEVMKCSPDVARLLARVCCTKDGALPTGSSISPFLSYFACKPMFDEINGLAIESGVVFTLYVDDMFFSGCGVDGKFKLSVLGVLKRYGFQGHKMSRYRAGQPRTITGVTITNSGLRIPYERHKRMRVYRNHFEKTEKIDDLEVLGKTLIGQYREASRIERGFLQKARSFELRLNARRKELQLANKA